MRSIIEQARDAFASDSCVIEGNLKLGREDWFCRDCWPRLPKEVQNSLKYQNRDWKERFIEALHILAEEKHAG